MPNRLEEEFHGALLDIYTRAKAEADYNATRFLALISDRGGVETARYLLRAPNVSDGYAAQWERGRLDLTVEATVLDSKWRPLFTDDDLRVAVSRLRDYGFAGPLPDLDGKR